MHAFFYAMPLRRRPIMTAALISIGAHAALFLGFAESSVPTATKQMEPEVTFVCPPFVEEIPPPPPTTNNPEQPEPAPPSSMNHARLQEPPGSLKPEGVTIEYRFDPGQPVTPGLPTDGIPTTELWSGRGSGPVIVDLKDLEKRPEPVVQTAPEYPFTAKNQGMEGVVIVRFIVTATGTVDSASIVSSPHGLFSEAALNAVKRWTFRAGMKNGRKVATRMEIPLTFRLSN